MLDVFVDDLRAASEKSSDYIPPEKGGDGTDGETTPEILSILRKCRRILNFRKNPNADRPFEYGDIVFDSRDMEHGVVLGEMPDLDFIDQQSTFVASKRKEISTKYIVLTITTDQNSGRRKTRIRYLNKSHLELIEETQNSMSDLDIFCSQQCMHECSPLCSLYKHSRLPQEQKEN